MTNRPSPVQCSEYEGDKSSHILAAVAFIRLLSICWASGLILPVMPRLIGEIAQTPASIASAEIGGLLTFAYAGMQFLCASLHRPAE